MKSCSCSMYILVFFEYSNSMWVSRRRWGSLVLRVAPTLGPRLSLVNGPSRRRRLDLECPA